MSIERVHAHIDSMREKDIAFLEELVRIPSSASEGNSEELRQCADLLKRRFNVMGFKSEIFDTPTQPVVYAERMSNNTNAKTILFYGHYDVQPAGALELWKTPPFEPTIINGKMYGRGTADNKGQFLAHILAIRSFLEVTGDLPVNVKFVLDGEEEDGSPSMEGFIRSHIDMLRCDVVYFSDGPVQASGAPEIKHGFRGMFSFQLDIKTAEHSNHSGRSGGLIPNAAIMMARLISSMIDEKNHITINGVYSDVTPASDYEKFLISQIPYDTDKLAKVYSVKEFHKTREEFYEQFMFLPTCTCNGMLSGYTGEGSMTIVPNTAMAKFDMRLVDNMDPDDIERKVRAHISKNCPEAQISDIKKIMPSKTRPDLPICKVVVDAARLVYPNAVAVPTSGGTYVDFVWTKILKVPSVAVPYGNADQTNHAPNENLDLACYLKGIHCSAEAINAVGNM